MPDLARPSTALERLAYLVACGVGLWALGNWGLGHPEHSSVLPGTPPVKPGVAAWMLLVGPAILLGNGGRRSRTLGMLLASVALVLVLAHLVLPLTPGMDTRLLPGPLTALSMGLASLALLLRDHAWRPRLDPSGSLALLAMLGPYFALLGYSLERAVLYRPASTEATALPTAIVLILVSLGVLASRPERAWMTRWRNENLAGALLRRQVPSVLLAPMVLGALALAGHRAQLYSEDMAIGFVLGLSGLAGACHTLWTSRSLEALEEARSSAIRDLHGSEAMFRGLMEGASDGILVIDELGRVAFENRRVAALFGYDHSELIGQGIDGLIPERFRAEHEDYRKAFMADTRHQGHGRRSYVQARRKDGSEFPAEISLSPLETVEGHYVMVLIRDLTELRRAAEAISALNTQLKRRNEEIEVEIVARTQELARQNALVQRAITHIPTGIAFVDSDLMFRWVNPELSRQLKRPAHELVNQHVSNALPDLDMDRLLGLQMLQIGRPVRLTGVPMKAGAAVTYWDTSLVPAFEDGSFQGFYVLANDVTARIELERMQQDHIAALERADALKDEFLNIVSHELRTPLSVLSGTLSLFEYELDGPLCASQRRDVARMRENTDHLLTLVNDLLDMSMIQAGKLAIVPKPLLIEELMDVAIDFVQPLATERRISIRTEIAADLPPLAADPHRLRQVLINLVSNSLKYSPPESIVTLRAGAEDGALRLEVSDEGPGIPPADQERIFEKFTRMPGSEYQDGAGLGLYICQALVKAHEGDIGVVSDGRNGSTFWVTLPVAR